eukprot:3326913-Rhodomonas_salina.2
MEAALPFIATLLLFKVILLLFMRAVLPFVAVILSFCCSGAAIYGGRVFINGGGAAIYGDVKVVLFMEAKSDISGAVRGTSGSRACPTATTNSLYGESR